MPNNLRIFPLRGLEQFIEALRKHNITQLSLTGTNTDPQLYAYEADLIAYLRERIPGIRLSLHTNGQMALKKIETFYLYDRATISLPSLQPDTYYAMTGGGRMPDITRIIQVVGIPLKISTILTEQNVSEIPSIIKYCQKSGISRMVLRKRYGDTRLWHLFPNHTPVRYFGDNPVYDIDGMEVTLWDFTASAVRCLNLFSDGTISREYQLSRR